MSSYLQPKIANKIDYIRQQFPALQVKPTPVYFDGPGGTQIPNVVIQSISAYLQQGNSNRSSYPGRQFRSFIDSIKLAIKNLYYRNVRQCGPRTAQTDILVSAKTLKSICCICRGCALSDLLWTCESLLSQLIFRQITSAKCRNVNVRTKFSTRTVCFSVRCFRLI